MYVVVPKWVKIDYMSESSGNKKKKKNECKENFFPLTLDGKKILKRATNLKMSCINNASEPLKEKNSGPEHNYENSGSTLLSCVIHHYFLAKAGYSFIGVCRVGKKSPFMFS